MTSYLGSVCNAHKSLDASIAMTTDASAATMAKLRSVEHADHLFIIIFAFHPHNLFTRYKAVMQNQLAPNIKTSQSSSRCMANAVANIIPAPIKYL